MGDRADAGLLTRVYEFTRRASNTFLRQFHGSSVPVTVMGQEWSALPAISLLHGIKNVGAIIRLHSFERQRHGLQSELSRHIDDIEMAGVREADAILVNDPAVAEIARRCVPQSAERLIENGDPGAAFRPLEGSIDAGAVKARYQIGAVDPTVVYVGDLEEGYGPDLLVTGLPHLLKKTPQVRLVVVGDGDLLWPLRVYARYLLLDHAARIIGHLDGQPLYELVQAADVVAIPSRRSTPWWPIEAGWAAARPVVATQQAAPTLLHHEQNCLVVDPTQQGCAGGLERVLNDARLRKTISTGGKAEFETRYNANGLAARIEELMLALEIEGQPVSQTS